MIIAVVIKHKHRIMDQDTVSSVVQLFGMSRWTSAPNSALSLKYIQFNIKKKMSVEYYASRIFSSISLNGLSSDRSKSWPSSWKTVLPSHSARSSLPICRNLRKSISCVSPFPSPAAEFQCKSRRKQGMSSETLSAVDKKLNRYTVVCNGVSW